MIQYFYMRYGEPCMVELACTLLNAVYRAEDDIESGYASPQYLVTEDGTIYNSDAISEMAWKEWERRQEEARAQPPRLPQITRWVNFKDEQWRIVE